MRLFVAVELALETKQAVVRAQETIAGALRRKGAPVRLTPDAQLHLTLVFIGEVDELRARAIADVLRQPLSATAFDIELGTPGVFPPRGRPRILWIGVERGRERLIAVYEQVVDRLASVGVPPEERPYSPHLTIGRWRDRDAPRPLDLPPISLGIVERVRAVTLFESRLHPEGARHTAIVRSPLGGAVDPLH